VQLVADGLRERVLGLPVIVGAEKGGQFAEQGCDPRLRPRGQLMVLDDRYTQTYMTFNGMPPRPRHLLRPGLYYGALTGQMHTITVPPLGHVGAAATGGLIPPIRTRPSQSASLRARSSALADAGAERSWHAEGALLLSACASTRSHVDAENSVRRVQETST